MRIYGKTTKLECINKTRADILCLTETHLCGNEVINLPGTFGLDITKRVYTKRPGKVLEEWEF